MHQVYQLTTDSDQSKQTIDSVLYSKSWHVSLFQIKGLSGLSIRLVQTSPKKQQDPPSTASQTDLLKISLCLPTYQTICLTVFFFCQVAEVGLHPI